MQCVQLLVSSVIHACVRGFFGNYSEEVRLDFGRCRVPLMPVGVKDAQPQESTLWTRL